MEEEPPPFLGSWKRVYVAIVLYTCALVLLLYWVTLSFNH